MSSPCCQFCTLTRGVGVSGKDPVHFSELWPHTAAGSGLLLWHRDPVLAVGLSSCLRTQGCPWNVPCLLWNPSARWARLGGDLSPQELWPPDTKTPKHQNAGEVGSTCFVSANANLPSELLCSFRLSSVVEGCQSKTAASLELSTCCSSSRVLCTPTFHKIDSNKDRNVTS